MREEGDALGALIWCPFPGEEAARAVSGALLDERLIACANLLPRMHSLFSWQGVRDESEEVGALLKTTAKRLEPAMARLRTLHPYEAPIIMGWTVQPDAGTLGWLQEETGGA